MLFKYWFDDEFLLVSLFESYYGFEDVTKDGFNLGLLRESEFGFKGGD